MTVRKNKSFLLALLLALCLALSGCTPVAEDGASSGDPAYTVLNENVPCFTADDLTVVSFETYSELDELGRCGVCFANVGQDIMPTGERGEIGQIKPTGWHTVKYDCVDGKYLYNRCHLIGYQLTGENANERNLITGTRYLNVEGMLPFENLVADYVKETGNHVLYRVTPVFEGDDLVAGGVEMEALSVEDNGEGVSFHVYCHNIQPGVVIDYATGDSWPDGRDETAISAETPGEQPPEPAESEPETEPAATYILNTNTMKFHDPACSSVGKIDESNKQVFEGSREELLAQGYAPCGQCKP